MSRKEHLLVVIRSFSPLGNTPGRLYKQPRYRAHLYRLTLNAKGELVYQTVAKHRNLVDTRYTAEVHAAAMAKKWNARVHFPPAMESRHNRLVKRYEPEYDNVRFKSQIAALEAEERSQR